MAVIFLSYSTKDQETANKLFEYFTYTFSLSKGDVFLSSVNVGTEYSEDKIVPAIKDAEFIVFLISENFLHSTYCLCELGAAWILRKEFYILLDGISRKDERIRSLPPFLREKNNVAIHTGDTNSIISYFEQMLGDISKVKKPVSTPSIKIVELARELSHAPASALSIDLRDAAPFHHPGTARETLTVDNRSIAAFSAVVDYTSVKPDFAGIVIPLMGQDWIRLCKQGYSLSFDTFASEPLSSLTLEMKRLVNGERATFATEKIRVGNKQTWTKRLDDLAAIEKYENLSEIVFLVEPSTFNAFSKFTISDMQIIR